MRLPGFLLLLLPGGVLATQLGGGCGLSLEPGIPGAGGGYASAVAATTSTSAGATGAGGMGGSGAGYAAPCTSDKDCAAGLSCSMEDQTDPVFGGGVAGGFCSKECQTNTDCVMGGGICYSAVAGEAGRCTLPCTVGVASPGKCLGRSDVRCVQIAQGVDACLPTCSGDAQCPGKSCDPETAVCVCEPSDGGCMPQPHEGAPTGTPCQPGVVGFCAGDCIVFDLGYGMCSRPCVLGGPPEDECGGPEDGICVFHPDPNVAGDTGYCTSACTQPSDCLNPLFGCFTVAALTPASGKGYCYAASACADGSPDAGPDAGTDAGPDAGSACGATGYVCVSTPLGPQCLDPRFLPVDMDGGASDGGEGGADAADGSDDDAGDASDDAGDASMDDGGDVGDADDAGDAGASDADAGP